MSKSAVIIVDMLKDNIDEDSPFAMGEEGRKIIPNIRKLIEEARKMGMPVIFANDCFLPDDFIFREGASKVHAIRGTEGAKVIDELEPQESDIILEKRRFSAFLGTGLDDMLKGMGVDSIVVAGVSTPVCVLTTVLDGLAHDFKVIWIKDCCGSFRSVDHDAIINLYSGIPLRSVLQIKTLPEFLQGFA